eukprot:TRINITY_DN4578_c0_g1_i1.p1 TRINITY_DN4578_c0_g1~~TRINITY_DN4578_c0_g1_i1.p1  ORF type:complete len:321 (+),score=56.05 TRINITY_DN4578_c0_g1_i1:210-1172(+)
MCGTSRPLASSSCCYCRMSPQIVQENHKLHQHQREGLGMVEDQRYKRRLTAASTSSSSRGGEGDAAARTLDIEGLLLHLCSFQGGRRGTDWSSKDGDDCVSSGHLSLLLMKEQDQQPLTITSKALETAAAAGDLPLLQHLCVRLLPQGAALEVLQSAFNAAALHGHLHVLRWLHSELGTRGTGWAMEGASRHGNLEIVRWLLGTLRQGCSDRAFTSACVNGHIEVVHFLHSIRPDAGGPWALHGAAMNGHLDIVQFLTKHCAWANRCTSDAMDLAAINGHLAVVKWLSENRAEGWTTWGLDGARTGGYDDVVEFLLSTKR